MTLYSKLSTKCCDAIACGLPDVRRTLCLLDCSQEEEPLLSLPMSASISSFELMTSFSPKTGVLCSCWAYKWGAPCHMTFCSVKRLAP